MEDRSTQIVSVAILFAILTWLFVSLRVYVRTILIQSFGLDDSLMCVSLAFYSSYLICQMGGVAHGTGKHRSQLTDHDAQIALRYWFMCELFYTLSTSVLKLSIGYFLMRITIRPVHIWIIRTIMLCSGLLGIVYCCVVLFQCHPISYWWDLNPKHHGICISAHFVAYTTYVVSSLNALADWVFGILPIFIVKDLQMRRSTKIIVATILGFAALGSTATLVRIPYIWTLTTYKDDFLWRTSDVAIWTTVEVGVGITVGCIATLKPVLKPLFATFGASSAAHTSSRLQLPTKHYDKSHRAQSPSGILLDALGLRNDKSVTITTTTIIGTRNARPISIMNLIEPEERGCGRYSKNPMSIDGSNVLQGKAWKGGIRKDVEIMTTIESTDPGIRGIE